jgi:hypothetical protein
MKTNITVTVRDQASAPSLRSSTRWLSVALTVLFVAYCYGLVPWLAGAAVLYTTARLTWRAYQRQHAADAAEAQCLAAIAARADQQHVWVMAGDDRGTYGTFPP